MTYTCREVERRRTRRPLNAQAASLTLNVQPFAVVKCACEIEKDTMYAAHLESVVFRRGKGLQGVWRRRSGRVIILQAWAVGVCNLVSAHCIRVILVAKLYRSDYMTHTKVNVLL